MLRLASQASFWYFTHPMGREFVWAFVLGSLMRNSFVMKMLKIIRVEKPAYFSGTESAL